MAIDVYKSPAIERARSTLEKYKGRLENGIGEAQTIVAVGGASYLAARLSAQLGGPEGKTILGIPLELAIGAGCGTLAMTGSAGKHAEDVLAVGVGAIAAYTARLGFQAGMQSAKPPVPEVGVALGPQYQLAAPLYQAALPLPVMPSPYQQMQQVEVAAEPEEEIGADPYAEASDVLDQYGRRR